MQQRKATVSGFTFVRNAISLGYPIVQSIKSILPICDEFVVNVGESTDNTLETIQAINDPKIKIIHSRWNPNIHARGFIFGEQKMIAQYSCSSDWAFYLEADEIVHEKDLPIIQQALQQHVDNPAVEALAFQYHHFYGNMNTVIVSPAWYRNEARIIKRSVRCYAPSGLYWVVLDKKNKKGRYPKAVLLDAAIYHYGWVRSEPQMRDKCNQMQTFWSQNVASKPPNLDYAEIDATTLQHFKGDHPYIIQGYFPQEEGLFVTNPHHKLTWRERKHRMAKFLEKYLLIQFNKKHFQEVKV